MFKGNRVVWVAIGALIAAILIIAVGWWCQPQLEDIPEPAGKSEAEAEQQRADHDNTVICNDDCEVVFDFAKSAEAPGSEQNSNQSDAGRQSGENWEVALQRRDLLAQERMAHWALWLAGLTAVGVVLIAGTFWEAMEATKAANNAARAAADQVNLMLAARRPSFELDMAQIYEMVGPSTGRDVRQAPMPERVWVALGIRNITPESAKFVTGRYGHCVASELPKKAEYPEQISIKPGTTVAGRGHISIPPRVELVFTREQRDLLDSQQARLWLWGFIVVEDAMRGRVKFRFAESWRLGNASIPAAPGDEVEAGFGWWAVHDNPEYCGEEYTKPPIP